MQVTTRNASFGDMLDLLKEQRTRRLDVVVPATHIRASGGRILVEGADPAISEEGVDTVNGSYDPTGTANETIAAALEIPSTYLRKLAGERTDIYDANVNAWLHGGTDGYDKAWTADRRSFLLRLLRGDETGTGVLRAMRSDRFLIIDNYDVLIAALDGIRKAGITAQVDGGDLTEKRMYVRVIAPEVTALAPVMLEGYRNPFHGRTREEWEAIALREGQSYGEGQRPIVQAGFVISNSDLGFGAYKVAPRIVFQICKNGLTLPVELAARHLGARLDQGIVKASADTQFKALALITAQTRDAVETFLSPEFLAEQVAELEAKAGVPVTNPQAAIKAVVTQTAIPAALEDEILGFFTAGGQMTAGGVANAVTAAAQLVPDADLAADLEAEAVKVMEVAGRAG